MVAGNFGRTNQIKLNQTVLHCTFMQSAAETVELHGEAISGYLRLSHRAQRDKLFCTLHLPAEQIELLQN